jgi:hypothetical protein
MKKYLLAGFFSFAAAALLVSAWACRKTAGREAPGPDAEQKIEPEPPGKCREPDIIKGTCTFLSMIDMPEDDPLKPAGRSAFGVNYSLKAGDGSIEDAYIYLTAAKADEERLREYYRENSPVACELHKFYPPCAPVGEAAKLKLDPPDFAELIDPLYP